MPNNCDFSYSQRYEGLQELESSLSVGVGCQRFVDLLVWLSGELAVLCSLEERIHPIAVGGDDLNSLLLELSSFLKEIGMTGPVCKQAIARSSAEDALTI